MQQQGEKQGLEVKNVLLRKTTTICPRLVGREAPPSGSGSRYVKERCTCLSNVIADFLMCQPDGEIPQVLSADEPLYELIESRRFLTCA